MIILNSPATQTQAITTYHDVLWDQIKARGLDNKVGQSYNGVPITQSGLIAAAHLIGYSGLKRKCLNGGSCADANNTTALSYMSKFGGFDVASITGSSPIGGHGSPINIGNSGGSIASNTNAPFPTGTAVSTSAAFAAGAGVDMSENQTVCPWHLINITFAMDGMDDPSPFLYLAIRQSHPDGHGIQHDVQRRVDVSGIVYCLGIVNCLDKLGVFVLDFLQVWCFT